MPTAKILIVDDNPSDTNVLSLSLSALEEDLEIEIVEDGQRALEFVFTWRKIQEEVHPCVIVLDLHLPKHDGLEILQAIRDEPLLGHVHVVVLTGAASRAEQARVDQLRAHYRTKPMALTGFEQLAADILAICKGLKVAA